MEISHPFLVVRVAHLLFIHCSKCELVITTRMTKLVLIGELCKIGRSDSETKGGETLTAQSSLKPLIAFMGWLENKVK